MQGFIVVDVQPAYHKGASHITRPLLFLLESVVEHNVPIFRVKVNEELSGDTPEDFDEYWQDAGASRQLLDHSRVMEKPYAFLRGWMDNGVPDDEIVATLKEMRKRGVNDSRQLPKEVLVSLSEHGASLCDPLFLPYELEDQASTLTSRAWTTCGGGRDECLKEFELWLDSNDVTYFRDESLVY
ncbi:hypothetical protein F6X40_34675 [Paraburkholderia sp. UCT31]|uniref:hypothetical protein n=1 Tax=Paraburkholderia sp. UCT31 TaxID=2615209 RepID=UPI001654C67A|nr:hypothetical protein [Paraburkholderia sp. UCT31]MBC8741709.1 hypothetical protein [Paraburkholderia sp. UCT31]